MRNRVKRHLPVCAVLCLFASSALAAGPAIGPRGPGLTGPGFPHPPNAGAHGRFHGRPGSYALGYIKPRWNYPPSVLGAGFVYPQFYGDDQAPRANAAAPAPRPVIYNVPRLPDQGEYGYVAEPVIYDVQREVNKLPRDRRLHVR